MIKRDLNRRESMNLFGLGGIAIPADRFRSRFVPPWQQNTRQMATPAHSGAKKTLILTAGRQIRLIYLGKKVFDVLGSFLGESLVAR